MSRDIYEAGELGLQYGKYELRATFRSRLVTLIPSNILQGQCFESFY